MTTLIAVPITPGPDGRCGECQFCADDAGRIWAAEEGDETEDIRGPFCLAAEARIATIRSEARVEALREVRLIIASEQDKRAKDFLAFRDNDSGSSYRAEGRFDETNIVVGLLDGMIALERKA